MSQDVFQAWQRIAHEDLCLNFLWDVAESSFRVHGHEEGAKKAVRRREREGYMPPSSRRTDAASVTLPTYLYILIQKEIAELGENKKKKDICCC